MHEACRSIGPTDYATSGRPHKSYKLLRSIRKEGFHCRSHAQHLLLLPFETTESFEPL